MYWTKCQLFSQMTIICQLTDRIYFPHRGGRGQWKIQGRGVKKALENPGGGVKKDCRNPGDGVIRDQNPGDGLRLFD